jgi:hypothetical protein
VITRLITSNYNIRLLLELYSKGDSDGHCSDKSLSIFRSTTTTFGAYIGAPALDLDLIRYSNRVACWLLRTLPNGTENPYKDLGDRSGASSLKSAGHSRVIS